MPRHAEFQTSRHRARELAADDLPCVQALFEANPAYFELVSSAPPRADEARQEFDDLPPEHLSYGRRWFLGFFADGDLLQGVAIVLRDLGAPGVWHIALFLWDSALHGSGAAAESHAALQAWAEAQGARWLRLGVVIGNTRAERFWHGQGYRRVRHRSGVPAGERTNTVSVLVKALQQQPLHEYLALVPRDHPDSTLP